MSRFLVVLHPLGQFGEVVPVPAEGLEMGPVGSRMEAVPKGTGAIRFEPLEDVRLVASASERSLEIAHGHHVGAPVDYEARATLEHGDLVGRYALFHEPWPLGVLFRVQADEEIDSRLREQLWIRATVEPMTGAFNRAWLAVEGRRRVAAALADATPTVCFVLVDLDRMLHLNDRYGHMVGDRVLWSVAERIRSATGGLPVTRVAGQAFALLERMEADAARALAETIRASVESLEIDHPDRGTEPPLRVTVSVGVAHGEVLDLASLYRAAEDVLYEAKRLGRNRVVTSLKSDSST
ncbi:MAG TPA: GGDEF domain-containing protein [bacterium]|nr:GGDEF domain-containing protein [bacterium]